MVESLLCQILVPEKILNYFKDKERPFHSIWVLEKNLIEMNS